MINQVNKMMNKAYNAKPQYNPFTDMGPGNQMQVLFGPHGLCNNILKGDSQHYPDEWYRPIPVGSNPSREEVEEASKSLELVKMPPNT